MKKFYAIFFILFLLFGFLPFGQPDNEPLSVTLQYPGPKAKLRLTGKPFYFIGMINRENALLIVNGDTALTDSDGAFVAFSPPVLFERQGKEFARYIFSVSDKQGIEEEVTYEFPIIPLPGKIDPNSLAFDVSWDMKPAEDLLLPEGERVTIEVRATPGAELSFTVDGNNKSFPMTEELSITDYYFYDALWGSGFEGKTDTLFGIYKGVFTVSNALKNAAVTVTAKKNNQTIRQKIPGTITTLDSSIPTIVETRQTGDYITLMTGPFMGYKMYLGGGVRFEQTGREGNWMRVKLAEGENGYILQDNLLTLEKGTPPPASEIQLIRVEDTDTASVVEFGFSEKVPYAIYQNSNNNSLELVAYNVTASIDFIKYVNDNSFVKDILWRQERDGVLRVTIFLEQKTHWGYWAEYDNDLLRLTINKPSERVPGFLCFGGGQLEGRRISIDPGHHPESGAVGPRGTLEKDVNFEICLILKRLLEDQGAEVHFTRQKNEELPLRERKPRVNEIAPEISISVHNNAVPQGVNPLQHNGSSVYYFYPQAKSLAEMVHKAFLEELKLPNYGLYYDNLYMCRIPESISILVEPAFMMIPEQERKLTEPEFQEKIAAAIVDGIEQFYEEYAE